MGLPPRSLLPQPVLACLSYAACSTLLTLANKAIFSEARLQYPWTLLGIQSVLVTLQLLVYFSAVTPDRPLFHRRLLRQLLMPCAFFTAFIFTNACALRHISIPVLTLLKSLAPMGIAIVESLLFRDPVSLSTYASMALILSANAVTFYHDIDFHPVGYLWASLNVLMNVAYVVSLRYCITESFSPARKTLHSNFLASIFIFPMAIATAELPAFFNEFLATSFRFRLLFLLSCVLATGIGASVFWVIQTASGSTLSFVGAANKVLIVILGAILFDAKISPAGWVGIAIGTVAGFWFAMAKAKAAAQAKREQGERTEKKKVHVEHADADADSTAVELLLERRQSSASIDHGEKG